MKKSISLLFATCVIFGFASMVVFGIGQLTAYFQQGADPASALNIVPNQPLDWPIAVEWRSDDRDTGREMEPFTREQIESSYVRAWLQLSFSHQKQEPFGLKTYFVGPALERVEAAVTHEEQIEQVALSHDLQLHFYSADGSIVSFTDHSVKVAQLIQHDPEYLLHARESDSKYDVVMMLEDGNWRVRHWVRTAENPPPKPLSQKSSKKIAGINYYPKATPWDLFWTEYDPEIIAKDIRLMQSLRLNGVRIFIPYQQFGMDEVDATLLANVQDFLTQAEEANLAILVTLFDFHSDYAMKNWPRTDRHLEQIVDGLRDYEALVGWDIKNEPDLDDDVNGQPLTDFWLTHTARLLRSLDDEHPITVGWSSAENAHRIAEELDWVSFHYYGWAAEYVDRYRSLQAKVGEKPIYLTEYGMPTVNSFFYPDGHSEQDQAQYFAELLTAVQSTDTAGYFVWTLHDFTKIPDTVIGSRPDLKAKQKTMGVVGKPASGLIGTDAGEAEFSAVEPVPAWKIRFKPFRITLILLSILGSIAIVWIIRKWKRK